MRVQPARPRSPLTTTPTESFADASAAWSAAQRPAPPAPRIRTSKVTGPGGVPRAGGPCRTSMAGCRWHRHEPAVAPHEEHRRRRGDAPGAVHLAVQVEE